MKRTVWMAFLLASWCVLTAGSSLGAKELSEVLRQASELYRVGQIDEARALAESYQQAFPHDLECLLILGRLEFDAGKFAQAKTWFRLASEVDRNHPLVKRYKKLFEELEHRRGPISEDYLPLPNPDKEVTAEKFRRGWFGPSFTAQYGKVPELPPSRPDSLGVATAPAGILYGESVDFLAVNALKKGWYLKAYLLYKDLVRNYPGNTTMKLGAAEAAIGMHRYEEAKKNLKAILKKDPLNQQALDLLQKAEQTAPPATEP